MLLAHPWNNILLQSWQSSCHLEDHAQLWSFCMTHGTWHQGKCLKLLPKSTTHYCQLRHLDLPVVNHILLLDGCRWVEEAIDAWYDRADSILWRPLWHVDKFWSMFINWHVYGCNRTIWMKFDPSVKTPGMKYQIFRMTRIFWFIALYQFWLEIDRVEMLGI